MGGEQFRVRIQAGGSSITNACVGTGWASGWEENRVRIQRGCGGLAIYCWVRSVGIRMSAVYALVRLAAQVWGDLAGLPTPQNGLCILTVIHTT